MPLDLTLTKPGGVEAQPTQPQQQYGWTTYAKRKINVIMRLGKGGVDSTSSNTVRIEGLRVSASITKVVGPSTARAIIRIYGLTLDHINQFTIAGSLWAVNRTNLVALEAGDDVNGMKVVFNGIINEAYPDFSQMPDAAFVIIGHTGTGIQLTPVAPTSVQGSTDAGQVFNTIAQKANIPLENNGVDAKLNSPYFPGSAWNQAILASKAADCFLYYDDLKNAMVIWKKRGSRQSNGDILISADTGMIGYPQFQQSMIMFRHLYDPIVEFGKPILAKTQFKAANGRWIVTQIDYSLESEMPGGRWEMLITTHAQALAT